MTTHGLSKMIDHQFSHPAVIQHLWSRLKEINYIISSALRRLMLHFTSFNDLSIKINLSKHVMRALMESSKTGQHL